MADAIKLGRMTDTMEEGFVAELNVKVGDKIKSGDTIAEIETDKATLPLESYYNGTILHVAAKKGDTLKIGDLIAIIGKEGEDISGLLKGGGGGSSKKEEKKDEAAESSGSKQENGEKEAAGDSSTKPEGEKKKAEVKESKAEKTEEKTKKKGEEEEEDEDEEDETVAVSSGSKQEKAKAEESGEEVSGRVKASPLARSIAKERGIDLGRVKGTGEEGRIVKRDLDEFKAAPSFKGEEGYKDVRVSQMRKAIAKRLTESKNTSPHFYLTIEINMDNAVALRSQLNNVLEKKVSFNDIVIKAAALALRQHPAVNSSWLGETIRQYQHIHIGMAVAVDEGLLVPVIKFADGKSVQQISEEAKSLAEKAIAKKLAPTEMEGNTFTISNLGMFGIEEFTAIINPPAACILAVGAIQQIPAVADGQIKISNRMKLTMSCDHRVVDGATGAKFLQTLKHLLENPVSILIE